jgi:hypothetical protein
MIGGEVFGAFVAVRNKLHSHQPPAATTRNKRSVDIGHEHRSDRVAIGDGRQIGVEDHVHPVLQDPRTMSADAHRFPDGALRAISSDEVLRSNAVLRPRRPIANSCEHLVARLCKAHQLCVEPHVGAVSLSVGTKDGFELILIARRCRGRTEVGGVRPRNALPRHFGVGQILHARDVRGPVVDHIAGANVCFDAGAAIDLHGAGGDAAEFVLNRCLRMPLDDEAWYAATSEEHCHGQPVEAAADDENGCGDLHVTILTNCFSRINYQDDPSHSLVREPHGLDWETWRIPLLRRWRGGRGRRCSSCSSVQHL